MSYTPPTRTWGELAQNLRRSFGDESGVQLEDGDIVRWINQGQYEIARQSGALKTKGTTTTMPGQAEYTVNLSKPILQIESVRCGKTRLIPTEFTTVDANYEQYPADAEGPPRIWYRWGDEITLWPVPKKAEYLSVYFTTAPVSHDSLDPVRKLELPDDYFLPLFDFCMSKAHEMDDNGQSQEMSNRMFMERMSTMSDEERTGQTLTYPTISIVD